MLNKDDSAVFPVSWNFSLSSKFISNAQDGTILLLY